MDLRFADPLDLDQMAAQAGFSSLGSFSSRFSELVGMSPSAFQRASAARGGPPPISGRFVMDWSRPRPEMGRQESNRGEA